MVWRGVRQRPRIKCTTLIVFTHHRPAARELIAEVRRVDSGNVEDALVYDPAATVARFRELLESGVWGYYAYLNGQWAHRSWVTLGPKKISRWSGGPPLALGARDAVIRMSETAPWARGKGVFQDVLARIVSDLSGWAENIYIATLPENAAARKAILRAGFQEKELHQIIGVPGIWRGVAFRRVPIRAEAASPPPGD